MTEELDNANANENETPAFKPVKKGTLGDQPGVIEETPIGFTPEDPS